jgi:hypothetical protein
MTIRPKPTAGWSGGRHTVRWTSYRPLDVCGVIGRVWMSGKRGRVTTLHPELQMSNWWF